jgi:hypothetical protein
MEPRSAEARRRAVRRLWAGVVVGGLALVVPSAPADAQDAAGTTIEVDAGYGGTYLVGRRLPVRVTVRTDRLVRGSIEVTVPAQSGSWGIDIEVPGGGVNDFVIVVPTPVTIDLREIDVRLIGAGEPITAEVDLDPLTDEQLVGLLPELAPPDLPEPLALPMEAGTARFVALDGDILGTAGVLDPLGTLVAGPQELTRLAPEARAAVLDWVDRGGRLLVDAAPGSPVAGLPEEWQPGAGGRAGAGLGEVRLTGGAAAAGQWAEIIEPTPTASMVDLATFGGFNTAQLEAVGDAVARDAGLSALDLPWLLAFLAAYVVLVGPVGWLVLRRRRAAIGWIAIPVVAGLFTAGSFVVGSDLRSGTTAAHGTVLETGPAGTRATTVLGLVSRNGRDGRGSFPQGWTAGGVDTSFFGGQLPASGDLAVRSGGGGVQATVPLAAGGFGVLRGAGPVDADGGLVVEAHSVGTEVVGTVRNDLPFAVDDAGVLLGRDTEQLGRIDAGETAEFRFEGRELDQRDPYSPPEASLWPAEAGYGPQPRFDSGVNLALWNEAHLALGPNARTRGVVTAIGWTRSVDTPAAVSGEGRPLGRSAIVGRAPVTSSDGSVAPGSAHREMVRGPIGVELPDEDVAARVEGAVFRFTLPAGATAADLTIDVPAYLGRVDAWDGSSWVPVDDRLDEAGQFNGDISQVRQVPLPPEAAAGGVVWLRGWLLADFGGFDGAGLEVRQT